MKRIYIKPVTENVYCIAERQLLENSVKWNVKTGDNDTDTSDDNVDPSTEPDPSGGAGAKGLWGMDDLWED